MRLLCLKHVPFEGPASIADWAAARGHELTEFEVFREAPLPDLKSFDVLLVMGGPMNVDEHEAHPWLVEEKALIRTAIEAGKVVVGICLGGQLIARALGAEVRRGGAKEIGWFPIRRAPDCPDWLDLPDTLRVFHWHGDRFDLPEGAVAIGSSEACPNQGFLYGDRALAWQCHLETTPASLSALADHCAHELVPAAHVMEDHELRAEPQATYDAMQAVLFRILDRITA